MEFIYARSYYGIFIALLVKSTNQNITVISPSTDIIELCKLLDIKYLQIPDIPRAEYLKNRKKIKNEIEDIIKVISDSKFHFSHKQFDTFCFILVGELIKGKKEIFFHPIEVDYENDGFFSLSVGKYLSYFKKVYEAIQIKLIWNLRLNITVQSKIILLSLPKSIFNNQRIEIVSYKKDFEKLKADISLKNQITLFKSKTLFISQNLNNIPELIENDSINDLYSKLKQLNMTVKLHPNMEKDNFFTECPTYPTFIPVEFLFSNVGNVISVHSASLITASYFPYIKTISLLNLLQWKDNNYKEKVKNILIKGSENRIVFPENYDELFAILN